ncbi:hypothetical protein, variant 1 [Aphanomyces invadans]|uniref:PH domain-containing protein n=1 Tax=Aphanomyces invadans TaxID=157072 RepID=A0A024TMZ7_9STRA|nr:hypothetical protein, variant 1 [Aphanomyces invadans]ETV95364.1 hypothetical protein, variant 1 [Aphanomyces invadans]|eukprot:XP_008876065.1 hypothetical protein, variant 1 [Aphanomyces invadans]
MGAVDHSSICDMGAGESTGAQVAVSGVALWKAAAAADVAKVRAITSHPDVGQDLNWIHPDEHMTPLMAAASAGKLSIVTLLVERGAAVDMCDPVHGNTALHFAAAKNKASVLEKLLTAGCDPHVWNKDGLTAMDLARFRGHREAGNVFARHLMHAKGWLYLKKGRSMLLSWTKRWCVIYECGPDHSRMELSLFHHPDDVKPTKVLFLTASENAASPRSSSRHRSKHSFSFTSTTTYQKYEGRDTFSRSLAVRKARHIPVYNASGFRFATETLEGRDKWIQLLGPLAFSNNLVRPMLALSKMSPSFVVGVLVVMHLFCSRFKPNCTNRTACKLRRKTSPSSSRFRGKIRASARRRRKWNAYSTISTWRICRRRLRRWITRTGTPPRWTTTSA